MAVLHTPIGKIASDIAQVWGIPDYTSAPTFAQDRIVIEINSAIQQMQDAGEDFYGREDIEITLVADQGAYDLDEEIQTVLDSVRLQDGTPLNKLTKRGQTLSYGQIFKDQLEGTLVSGKPEAYFIDTVFADSPDSTKTILNLFPPPSSGEISNKVVLPVIKEAALFTGAQVTAGTASLAVPHRYVESIFLPLARYNATTFFLFYQKEKMPKYEADYERALQLLGVADPRKPKPADSNSDALQLPNKGRPPPG